MELRDDNSKETFQRLTWVFYTQVFHTQVGNYYVGKFRIIVNNGNFNGQLSRDFEDLIWTYVPAVP